VERGVRGHEPAWWFQLGDALDCVYADDLRAILTDEAWVRRCRHLRVSDAECLEVIRERIGCFERLISCSLGGHEHSASVLALLRAQWPASLRSLSLNYHGVRPRGLGRKVAEAIAQNASLAGLEELDLARMQLGDSGAKALAQSPHLTRLRALNLEGNKLGAAGAKALAQSPNMAGLTRLGVSKNQIGMGLVALMGSPHTRALTHLEVHNIPISAVCARALRQVEWPPGLEGFGLDWLDFGRGALGALADAPGLRAVSSFDVPAVSPSEQARFMSSLHLTGLRALQVRVPADAALIAATRNPALSALHELLIRVDELGEPCVEALAQSVFRASLRSLSVQTSPSQIVSIFESNTWPALRELALSGLGMDGGERRPMLSDADVERLARCEVLRGLGSLCLDFNTLSDVAAMALADSGALGELWELELTGNQIGDQGLIALINDGGLANMASLGLADNRIGDVGAAALAASPLFAALNPPHPKNPNEGLQDNHLGLPGIRALLRSPYIDKADSLNLSGMPLTHEDILALTADPALANLRGRLTLSFTDEREETWQALIDSPYTNQWIRDNAQWRMKILMRRGGR
jgi:hypothetical protein